jgi:hypothetical protein
MKGTKEKMVRLRQATVVTFEGPGSDWICVMRGTREETPPPTTRGRYKGASRRREGRA